MNATYSFLGKGEINLQGPTGGLMPIGNCSNLELGVETDSLTQADYTQPGGGNANEIARVSSVTMSMTMLDFRPDNLAVALRGSTSAVTAGTVTDERHTAYVGGLIALDSTLDKTQTVTVTIDPDGAGTSAVEGTDFEVTNAGLKILEGGAINDSDTIGVDYSTAASDVIEALTNSGLEYKLVFDGLNEAESDKQVVVTVHRVKFTPAAALAFIGDDFGELALDGSVLIDSTKTGQGTSKYFNVAMAQ